MACRMRWLCLFLVVAAASGGKAKDNFVVKPCPTGEVGNLTLYDIVQTDYTCMHIIWSIASSNSSSLAGDIYPSLFIAHSGDTGTCECRGSSLVDDIFESEGDTGFVFPLTDGDVSLGVIFKGIYGFSATTKNLAGDALNLTYACSADNDTNEDNDMSEDSYFSLSNITDWTFVAENQTFVAHVGNFTRFSIRIGVPKNIGKNHLPYFPKTLFHENSTTFDFICDNYTCTNNSDCQRLALEFLLVHGANLNNGSIVLRKTVDDEYTPSVFSAYTYEAQTKTTLAKNNYTWFLQWKPISYQDSNRKSTSSQMVTVVTTGDAEECAVNTLPNSLVSNVYKGNHGNITRWFVVFGTSGDDSYINPTYNTWTVAVGAVTVPSETFSFVVYITIIVGFGVPGALVILSMVYVVLRRKPWQNVSRWMNRNRGYTKLS